MDVNDYLELLNEMDAVEQAYRKASPSLSLKEFRVLNLVDANPLHLNKISGTRSVAPQGIGKLCARLEKRGLLQIERDRRDKRAKNISLTPAGRETALECKEALYSALN
jgi:DNA-binding MarR family transcriptional regulator